MPNLFMIDLEGTEVSQQEKALLQHPNVGALILFSRNYKSSEQLKNLVNTVRTIRPDIFIATDHEGGVVQRFTRDGFRSLPAARVYGETYDINKEAGITLATKFGNIMATDLLNHGLDVSLAPVLDLHGNNHVIGKLDRAFHANPDVVTTLTAAFIKGMQQAGMPAVAKHFPGHGSFSGDSHVTKPVFNATLDELSATDLKPFAELIKKNLLAAVMPAHVIYSNIDNENTAGFSKKWLQTILREQLNFQGFIISDCLGMTGADIGNLTLRANKALEAGCDMIIVCNQTRELLHEVLESVTYQPADSAQRLNTFKKKMLRFNNGKVDSISINSTSTSDTTSNNFNIDSSFNKTRTI